MTPSSISSIRLRLFSDNLRSMDLRFSSICSGRDAPIIADETLGRFNAQARANWLSLCVFLQCMCLYQELSIASQVNKLEAIALNCYAQVWCY